MADVPALGGGLQTQIMGALWRLGSGTVGQVREALPAPYRGAYTTVQTVLNRLAERGLLARERRGRGFVYSPRLSEAEYLSRNLRRTLAGASAGTRQEALAQFVDGLGAAELSELQRLAQRAARDRRRPAG